MEKTLIEQAKKAMEKAYAPYSDYYVGAALLTKDGNIYTGCNIENSAFTPTVCAERVAIFKAVSNGEREFKMLAIAGGKKGKIQKPAFPCGVCRQVLSEFVDEDFVILILKNENEFEKYTLGQLLPKMFSPKNLTE